MFSSLLISACLKCPLLHPVFGLDEDWNSQWFDRSFCDCLNCIQSSGWMRIGTALGTSGTSGTSHCIQSSGWMRIGTDAQSKVQIKPSYCIQSSGWMRIGTLPRCKSHPIPLTLHPVFGLDEDWNIQTKLVNTQSTELHPVFELD